MSCGVPSVTPSVAHSASAPRAPLRLRPSASDALRDRRGRRDHPARPVSGRAAEDVHDGGGTLKAPDLVAPALPTRPRLRPRKFGFDRNMLAATANDNRFKDLVPKLLTVTITNNTCLAILSRKSHAVSRMLQALSFSSTNDTYLEYILDLENVNMKELKQNLESVATEQTWSLLLE